MEPPSDGQLLKPGGDAGESEGGAPESDCFQDRPFRRSIAALYLARHGLEPEMFARHLIIRCRKPGRLPWIWKLWPHSRLDLEFLDTVGRAEDWNTVCDLLAAYRRRTRRRRNGLASLFFSRLSSGKLLGIVIGLLPPQEGFLRKSQRTSPLAEEPKSSRPDLN